MPTRSITEANLVAYLKARGFQETTRPKLVNNVVTFFFEDSPELINEIGAFFSREATVEPLAICESLRIIKALIGDIRRNQRSGGGQDE